MQLATRIVVSAVLIITPALTTLHQNSAKLRRDGVLNLYPFPRVGRSSIGTWEVPLNDLYIEYKPTQKRQLYAFPRVGRSEAAFHLPSDLPFRLEQFLLERSRSHGFSKRGSESTDSSGMWFGPRLGRSFKSDMDSEQDVPSQRMTSNELSASEQTDPGSTEDRQKRQSE